MIAHRVYKNLPLLWLLSAALLFAQVSPLHAENAYQGEYGKKPDQPRELKLIDQTAIESFYQKRGGEPFWLDGVRLNANAVKMIEAINKSWTHGLNAEAYHAHAITAVTGGKIRNRMRLSLKADAVMTFELMLTDAYVRYVTDLSGMRVKASALGLNAAHWRQSIAPADALSLLEEGDGKNSLQKALDRVTPQGPTYKALQKELIALTKKMREDPESRVERVLISSPLSPGRAHKEVPKLRRRLGIGAPADNGNSEVYDATLAEAVKKFQAQKGLKPDGVIGAKTLYVLNQSIADKIVQLAVNLERLRWMPHETAQRVVMVNLPSATLWALENGKPVLEMPVIVGRPKRATLSFRTEITGVRFNPDWTVPPTIQKEDILPQLIEDPGLLVDKGMEVYSGHGAEAETLDPMVVDWANMTQEEYRTLRLVQIPGAHNPLGRIRVLMPNAHNIYLHDTNDRKLFSRSDRAQSSGCIRVQEPEKLAAFILSTKPGWTEDQMQKNLKGKKTRDIMIPEKIPVYLLYNTAWVGPEGQVVFGEDIYGNDKKLSQALNRTKGIFIPGSENEMMISIAE